MRNIIKDNKVHYLWIKTSIDNPNKLILKLHQINVNIYNILYEGEFILFEIEAKDFKKIKKYLLTYKFSIEKNSGIYGVLDKIKKYNRFICAIIFGIAVIYFFSNIIVEVNVIHSKKEIRELVTNELEEYGVKRLTLKKNYKQLQKIKENILKNHQDKLEWIEIETNGMTYTVRIEERIITNIDNQEKFCHIVAKKSAVITKIVTTKGVVNTVLNKYVSKGDILISGEIKLNEEVKNNVCASGKVYGEVWYTVDVSLPLNYETKKRTGKMRYNLMYQNKLGEHVILNSRLENKEVENSEIISFFGRKLYLQREYEVEVKKDKYTEDEALTKALELAKEKVSVKLDENERIIAQKVLKKTINDSTMILEVFTSVEEQIGGVEEYKVDIAKENNNDLESSR